MSRIVLPSDPAYLKAAFSVLGLSEIEGARHEKKVLAMYAASGHPEIHEDEVPWCAAFIGWALEQGGLVGTHSLMAASYATYGTRIDPKKYIPRGAIAVWKRTGGGHVNFVLEDDGKYVTCIGGNQGNGRGGGVTISRRAKSQAVAYRMPPSVTGKVTTKTDDNTPKRIAPEDGTQIEPKSMATSKIGVTQIASGATATVAAGAQAARPFMETTQETITQVSDVATQTGTIIETTKVVTTLVPDTIWVKIIHGITSPEFVACAVLFVVASCGFTWFWRRQHRQAGV